MFRVMDVLREGDDTAGGGAGAPAAEAGGKNDAEFYKAEAQKAFKARDEAKRLLREAQESGRFLTDEQLARVKSLEEAAAKAEDERKRKAGEFDGWRADILKKHTEELTTEKTRAQQAQERLHSVLKDHAFASASEWFGGSDAKTILTPAIAASFLGRYVAVEEHDGVERVVVKNPQGHVIVDAKTGEPAPFTQAVGELIGMLPDKASILRGSGKTGSGSSGGTGGRSDIDFRNLTPDQRRDPKVLAALRATLPRGGVVMGEAYEG